MNERLIDLDELIIRCKEEVTQQYIKEAVACYKAGAFRSCIISTWNAVVFDYLSKLRQLQLTGDAQAKEELDKFESYRLSKENYNKLWKFELSLPETAHKKFEFISLIEQEDLERLNHDRSRCAHPSILLDEEPFQPTPELARYHLRNAVMHLLQYPPVHGRVAIARVKSMIESAGFPENTEEAIEIIKDSYLSRARTTLIKDVIIELTHGLLNKRLETNKQQRMYAALGAISHLHFEEFQKVMSNKLLPIIESVEDENWPRVFNYLRRMQLWDFLKEKHKIQVKGFIQNVKKLEKWEDTLILLSALDSPKEIKTFALEKLKTFSYSDLTPFIEFITRHKSKIDNEKDFVEQIIQPYKSHVIQGFINSKGFSAATPYTNQLILVTSWLNSEEIKNILKAFSENDEISRAYKVPAMMISLFQETIETSTLLKNEWLLIKEKIENRPVYAQLLQLINDSFSDIVLTLDSNKENKDSYTTES